MGEKFNFDMPKLGDHILRLKTLYIFILKGAYAYN